jgi:uncharacterized protein YggU (UPF0235/DUF167 family)
MLKVRLTPKASRDAIEGLEDFGGETVLKARVRAVPEAGRANTALVKLIAAWLELPARNVSVAQGTKSRLKHLDRGRRKRARPPDRSPPRRVSAIKPPRSRPRWRRPLGADRRRG